MSTRGSGASGGGGSVMGVVATICVTIAALVRFCTSVHEDNQRQAALEHLRTSEMCWNMVSSLRAPSAVKDQFSTGCIDSCLTGFDPSSPLGRVGCVLSYRSQHPIEEAPPAPVQDCDRMAQPPRAEMGKVAAFADGVALAQVKAEDAMAACTRAMAEWPTDWRFIAYAGRAAEAGGDAAGAVALYRRASEKGESAAQYSLALMNRDGRGGLSRSEYEAVRLLQLVSARGYTAGQCELSAMSNREQGGLRPGDSAALSFLRPAAEAGCAAAQYGLASDYRTGGGGLAKDEAEAMRLYGLAAAQGLAPAQVVIGYYHAVGQGGLALDETEAVRLFRLAADQGDALGQFDLGLMTEQGKGGLAKDEVAAARLYALAAAQNYAPAQFTLGARFEGGNGGLAKDQDEAVRLYRLAAAQGNAQAKAALERLGVR